MSSHEKKVKKSLEESATLEGDDGFDSRSPVPTENVSEVKKGQQRSVEKRMWPGYLL